MAKFQGIKIRENAMVYILEIISLADFRHLGLLCYGPWEDRVSSLGIIFGGFFNPWDEEISIPETRPIRKSYIPV